MSYYNDLELDLSKIEHLGKLREDENYRFRSYLKGKSGRKIDAIVHRLNKEISERIDCTACGNCCKHLCPAISKEDLKNLSSGLGMEPAKIVEKYTETIEGELSFKLLPCAFLKENKCSIYEHRPESCSSYPHLHKKDFIHRLWTVIDNYSICPIVFNVFERLKQELHFR